MNKDKLYKFLEELENIIKSLKTKLQNSEEKSGVGIYIFSKLGELFNSITSLFGSYENFFKFTSNYQELEKDKYTFKEVVEWFKENKPEGKYIGAVLKSKEKTEKGEEVYRLDLVFLDAETESPCMINCPYMVVRTFYLDPELNDLFGNKDLLLLK